MLIPVTTYVNPTDGRWTLYPTIVSGALLVGIRDSSWLGPGEVTGWVPLDRLAELIFPRFSPIAWRGTEGYEAGYARGVQAAQDHGEGAPLPDPVPMTDPTWDYRRGYRAGVRDTLDHYAGCMEG